MPRGHSGFARSPRGRFRSADLEIVDAAIKELTEDGAIALQDRDWWASPKSGTSGGRAQWNRQVWVRDAATSSWEQAKIRHHRLNQFRGQGKLGADGAGASHLTHILLAKIDEIDLRGAAAFAAADRADRLGPRTATPPRAARPARQSPTRTATTVRLHPSEATAAAAAAAARTPTRKRQRSEYTCPTEPVRSLFSEPRPQRQRRREETEVSSGASAVAGGAVGLPAEGVQGEEGRGAPGGLWGFLRGLLGRIRE